MNTDSQWNKQGACFARVTQVWLAVNQTPVPLLVNEFDVRSALHGQVSLAAFNQFCVVHIASKM